MTTTIHSSEITKIEGYRSDESDLQQGLPMERIKISATGGHETVVWLTREQIAQMRAALDALYPVEGAPTKGVKSPADTCTHTCPSCGASTVYLPHPPTMAESEEQSSFERLAKWATEHAGEILTGDAR